MTKDEALKLAMEALETNNQAWKHLADSGDAGFWEAEEQPFYEMSAKAFTAIKEALMSGTDGAQPEPWEKFCDSNCVWTDHHPDCKLAEQEPVAWRYALTDEEIWVLTSEYNDYDQHGEYFEAVFIGKPTSEQIQKHCHVTEQGAVHILNGGGRVKYEDQWYNLRKEKAAHGIIAPTELKGEV